MFTTHTKKTKTKKQKKKMKKKRKKSDDQLSSISSRKKPQRQKYYDFAVYSPILACFLSNGFSERGHNQ